MDFRNGKLRATARIILGLLLLAFGGSGLYFAIAGAPPVPGETELIKSVITGLTVSGLLFAAKVVEIATGLMLLTNFRPAFAALLLAPVTVCIVVYDLVLWLPIQPAALIPAIVLLAGNVYLGYAYWDKYRQLFTA